MNEVLDVAAELVALDASWAARRPELVAAKSARMKEGAFPFLRGTAPLFFMRLRQELAAPRAPELEGLARWLEGDATAATGRISWCAGDVHVENFAVYRAPDGEERFGLNDFDNAVVAPIEVDVLRHATSVLVAARSEGARGEAAFALGRSLLETYARELATAGPQLDPTRADVSEGPIGELLDAGSDRSRQKFIENRAPEKKGKRGFVTSDRYRPLAEGSERAQVLEAFARAVASLPAALRAEGADFYKVVDAATRTAGLGSLGCGRYAVLVQGKGGDSAGVLLELKEAKPASLARRPGAPLRSFEDEAARVVAGQLAIRSGRALHLGRATLDGTPYYLHRLSHNEERVNLSSLGSAPKVLAAVVEAEAQRWRGPTRGRASLSASGPSTP